MLKYVLTVISLYNQQIWFYLYIWTCSSWPCNKVWLLVKHDIGSIHLKLDWVCLTSCPTLIFYANPTFIKILLYFLSFYNFFYFSHKVEQSLWNCVFKALCCGCLDISISNDMETVSKRYVHPLHSSQQASKAPRQQPPSRHRWRIRCEMAPLSSLRTICLTFSSPLPLPLVVFT